MMATESAEGTTLYVGNLPFDTTEEQVKDLCAAHGKVYASNTTRLYHLGFARLYERVACVTATVSPPKAKKTPTNPSLSASPSVMRS